MILKNLSLSLAAVALMAAPLRADEKACTAVAKETTEAVAAAPEKVLQIVSDLAAKNPSCACDVIGAALVASKADAELRKQIIEAAATAAPTQLEAIIACTKSPDIYGGDTGKGVVGKEPVGKQPKGVVPPPPVTTEEDFSIDFGLFRQGIGGVYIGSPSAGSSTVDDDDDTVIIIERPRIIVKRPNVIVSPGGP